MALLVGYPISYETACQFFKVSADTDTNVLMPIIKEAGLEFVYVDKGQYILGVEVYTGNLFDTFLGVDESIVYILLKKKALMECIAKANIDISDFMLQPLGDEAFHRVSNPEPYLIRI